MYFVAVLRLCSVRSMKSVVSSANVSALDSCFAYVIPVMCLVVVILMRNVKNPQNVKNVKNPQNVKNP